MLVKRWKRARVNNGLHKRERLRREGRSSLAWSITSSMISVGRRVGRGTVEWCMIGRGSMDTVGGGRGVEIGHVVLVGEECVEGRGETHRTGTWG